MVVWNEGKAYLCSLDKGTHATPLGGENGPN